MEVKVSILIRTEVSGEIYACNMVDANTYGVKVRDSVIHR